MSILIKGMEMPKNCYGCCFFHQVDYWNRDNEADILSCCKRTGEKTFDDFIKYLPNCPLVPVPPHSRLIDADTIGLTNFEIILCKQEKEPYKEALKMVLNKIEKSPTIISEDERRAEE